MSFGGFGSSNTNTGFGGFGGSSTGGGFGANNNTSSGGSLFGGNSSTSGGFGGSGFGASNTQQQSNPFAAKPAFGASTATTSGGGGLFGGGGGSNTATSGGFGGFGSTNNTNTTAGFGSTNTSGGERQPAQQIGASGGTNGGTGLFGQNKPAASGFGASNTGGSLFGGGSGGSTGGFGSNTSTTGGFGPTNNASTGGFGSNAGSGGGFAFGGGTSAGAGNNNQGSAAAPFQAFQEKEGTNNATSLYQSLTFQDPYKNKSFEELRLEDYQQGRRYGNSNGQAGAFGQSTGFGGFGASNNAASNTNTGGTGLFGGSNNNQSTTGSTGFGGFGANNNSTTTGGGFGSNNTNTGGGLFGAQQNKPANSLFGNTQQTSGATTGGFGSTAGSGTGLFGNSSGGFGSNTNTQQSGGLFGANNNQQQNKPAFGGGFGSTTNNTSTGGFGSNTQQSNNPFGGQNQQSGTSLFGGGNNQPQQQSTGFGASTNTGTGLFGGQQNKPTNSLFGNTGNTSNTGGSTLFGGQTQQQPQQQNTSLFGGSTNNNSSGTSLFGGQNQNKPAGNNLFGSTSNTGGTLFGNNNNNQPQQQNTGFGGSTANNSLFGNQNKPAGTTSLFGGNNSTSNTGGGLSLFGNSQQNQQNNAGTSMFGGQNQNQNQQNNSGSLFGNSFGQSSQQQPQQNQLHASLTGAPYGNEQLFSSLAAPSPPVGPLATPLSGARPAPRKTPSLLASARLNTPTQFGSPRGSTVNARSGYGFNYSTYGTPGSAFTAGSLTPGASSLLRPTGSLSSGLTSRLNKSSSMSSLRGESPVDGRSLLRPGMFSPPGSSGLGNRNVRKLNIDRGARSDLFPPPRDTIEAGGDTEGSSKKRVNFESPREETATPPASSSNALVRTEDAEERGSDSGRTRSSAKGPEMEQVNGTNGALSTVPEDSEPTRPSSAPNTQQPAEKSRRTEIGEYWTKPAMKDLKKFSRQQLKNVGNFVVGREGVGSIDFGSVDLSNTTIEDICGNIVQLNPRSATVYQDNQNKPAMGKALNVPSTIHLDNSWPRSHGGRKAVSAKSGPEYDKHIRRLKRVGGTNFQNYNPGTGVWTFTVEHFTTYELNDDDDDESEFDDQMQQDSSGLSDAPETPTGEQQISTDEGETPTGEMEDTFQFKLDRRSQMSVPGVFDEEGVSYDYDDASGVDETMEEEGHMMSGGLGEQAMQDPFTSSGGPVQAPSPGAMDRYHSSMMEDDLEDAVEDVSQEIPGSFAPEPKMPKSILKATSTLPGLASPEKLATDTWEEQLQRTLSPKKRDRQALRDMQQSYFRAQDDGPIESPFKQSMLGQSALGQSYLAQKSAKKNQQAQPSLLNRSELGQSQAFTSAKDIMDSLWAQDKPGKKASAGAKGFELPYPKKRRLSSSDDLRPNDLEWHDTMKPRFTDAKGIMAYSIPGAAPAIDAPFEPALKPIVSAHKDVRFARFKPLDVVEPENLLTQKRITKIEKEDGFPVASVPEVMFLSMADSADPSTLAGKRERWILKLCSIFLDMLSVGASDVIESVPPFPREALNDQARMDALAHFWTKEIIAEDVQASLKRAQSAEEKALVLLTANDVAGACEVLAEVKDFKLAMMLSQLPTSDHRRDAMATQIENWRQRNDWSEMSDAVKALYSILAGNTCNIESVEGDNVNKVKGFNITEYFGFSWKQSFALRLLYGGHHNAIEAIQAFGRDLTDGLEPGYPAMRWDNGEETDDALIELLMLLAGGGDLDRVFDAKVIAGDAFNTRLTWQLATILSANGNVEIPDGDLDRITLNYATETEASGGLLTAAWVTIHLTDSKARMTALENLLERNAEEVTNGSHALEANVLLKALTEVLHIPAALVHRTRALYAASNADPAQQTLSLLLAGDIDAAHRVICTTLGPQAVIEQEHTTLSSLLEKFGNQRPAEWSRGGGVYADFIKLVSGKGRDRNVEALVGKLRKGLGRMQQGVQGRSLEERVAVGEMERIVEEMGKEVGDDGEGTGDVRMSGAAGLGEDVGRDVEEGARMLERFWGGMGIVA